MRAFQEKWVAVTVMVLAILLSLAWGFSKGPQVQVPDGAPSLDGGLDTAPLKAYLVDEPDLLSDKTERDILLYNANWQERLPAVLGVVVMDGVRGDLTTAAGALRENLQLGENDGLLLVDASTGSFKLVAGGTMEKILSAQGPGFVDSRMGLYTEKGDLEGGVLSLFGGIHKAAGPWMKEGRENTARGTFLKLLLVLPLLLLAIYTADVLRFRRWYAVYGTTMDPEAAYRPLLWKYYPGSSWYRFWSRVFDRRRAASRQSARDRSKTGRK